MTWLKMVTWGDGTQSLSLDMVWDVYVAVSFCMYGAGGRKKQLVALSKARDCFGVLR